MTPRYVSVSEIQDFLSCPLTESEAMVEFHEAWRLCGLRSTTWEQFQLIIRGLCFVLTRCPESAVPAIEAALLNAERRAAWVARLGVK